MDLPVRRVMSCLSSIGCVEPLHALAADGQRPQVLERAGRLRHQLAVAADDRASQNASDAVRCRRRPCATSRPSPGRMKLVFISIVTTPDDSTLPSSPGLRAACAIATSSSVISDAAVRHAPPVAQLARASAAPARPHPARCAAAPGRAAGERESRDDEREFCHPSRCRVLHAPRIAETPPSIGRTWPVMCLPACDGEQQRRAFQVVVVADAQQRRVAGQARRADRARSFPWSSCSGTCRARAR